LNIQNKPDPAGICYLKTFFNGFSFENFYVDKPEKLVYNININKISHPPMVEGVGPSLCGGLLFSTDRAAKILGCEPNNSPDPFSYIRN
jgi:hypothetical protein